MKRIVIMGATSGIGLETAKRCIAAGWRVGAAGRRSEELERLRGLAPQQVETEAIDVTDDAAPAALERLIERLGGMDVYLHVAGVGSQNPQLDPTVELHTVRTNVEGFTRMTTAAYGYFAAHGGGRIAVVSSIAGTRGLGVAAAYSASKRLEYYIDYTRPRCDECEGVRKNPPSTDDYPSRVVRSAHRLFDSETGPDVTRTYDHCLRSFVVVLVSFVASSSRVASNAAAASVASSSRVAS